MRKEGQVCWQQVRATSGQAGNDRVSIDDRDMAAGPQSKSTVHLCGE